MSVDNTEMNKVREAIEAGDIAKAVSHLDTIIERSHNTEAMYLRAQIGVAGESESAFNARRIKLLTEASTLGHPGAAYDLSIHLETGDITPQDSQRAIELLQLAASQHHPHAVWQIGEMYLYGSHTFAQNTAHGLAMIEEAAALKSQGALRSLADFYANGKFGYPRDIKKANELLSLADSDDCIPL